MNTIHLQGIDLNLLLVFDAVMAEANVSRAADRIGLTQPAVSHALGRLRRILGDPLFVRTPKGMLPTPAALRIASGVREVLEKAGEIFSLGRGFDASTSNRRFAIGLSDYAAAIILPGLMKRLAEEAPATTLVVKNTGRDEGFDMLERGAAELIAGVFPKPPAHMREEKLFRDGFACAVRRGHPALRRKPSLRRYLEMDHLQVSTRGDPHGMVDAALAEFGARRKVAVTIGHFLLAPLLVRDSDLVATEPRRLFQALGGGAEWVLTPPPIPLPEFQVVQAWHSRHDADPGHCLLRECVKAAHGVE